VADVFETIGDIASPLAPALDFLGAPTAQQTGQGFSIGELMGSLGKGVQTAVQEGPAALLAGAGAALDPSSGMSGRDRLLVGGMTVAGVVGARAAHQAWKARMLAGEYKAAPSGYGELVGGLSDRPRYVEHSPAAAQLVKDRPGIHPRTAQILAAEDYDGVTQGLGRWAPDDEAARLHSAVLFERYALSLNEGAEAAQSDLARFDGAMDRGVFAYDSNASIRKLWTKFTTAPQTMRPEEVDELFSGVRAFADATQSLEMDDLSFGPVGRVERAELTADGVTLYTSHPVGWTDGSAVDEAVRRERLRHLNYRALAPRGKEMLRRLYTVGMQEWETHNIGGGPSRLPTPMEVGPAWYPVARRDVAAVFGIEDVDSDDLARAVASVSFLSEAEDWSNNVAKAHRVMTTALPGSVEDEDFQAWLRAGTQIDVQNKKLGRYEYFGSRGNKHEVTLERIHGHFLKNGFKVSKADLRKVLRLRGGFETADNVFRSTEARKQKNFYLNIYHPDLEHPVTIDRHAYDAFFGMDTGTQDRPIDQSLYDGDQVYDVVADTYRSLASELGILPHQLQAVVWEVWRSLKMGSGRNGWSRNDPFMIPEADGSTNIVFEALNGRGLHNSPSSLSEGGVDILPLKVLEASDVGGLGTAALPNGSVAYLADVTDEAVSRFNNLYPAVVGADRVARWVNTRPTRVDSIEPIRAQLGQDPTAWGESWLNLDLDKAGGHPLLAGGESIVYELPDGKALKLPRGLTAVPVGRVATDRPEFLLERLGPEDLDPATFADPATSPLKTHSWAAISADLGSEQVATQGLVGYDKLQARNALRAELMRRGYNPIDQEGIYEGGQEPSFLVFGIGPEEALELGEKFGQDSVLVNSGFLYNRATQSGLFEPTNDIEFNIPDDADFRSRLVIGDQEVTWASADFADPVAYDFKDFTRRTSATGQKFVVKVPDRRSQQLGELAEEIERRGGRNLSVYGRQTDLPGFARVRESLYTDGQTTYATRSETGDVTTPNSGWVFTKVQEGLDTFEPAPVASRDLGDGRVLLNNSVVLTGELSGTVGITLSPPSITQIADGQTEGFDAIARIGKKTVVDAADDDVLPAIEARNILAQAGVEGVELGTSAGKFGFEKTSTKGLPKGRVLLKGGLSIPPLRRDSPQPDWERDFGIEFDPGYRIGRHREQLHPEVIAELKVMSGKFFDAHGDLARRWRLPRVVVSELEPQMYAALEWKPGGAIVLGKRFWSDVPMFMDDLRTTRSVGHLSPRASVSPSSILAHEYGHVIHGAIMLEEGFNVATSKLDAELRRIAGGAGWRTRAKREISSTAAIEPAELAAEAYSEMLTAAQPSMLAQNVYDLLVEKAGASMKFRKVVGL
jgi:hypothetical protein